MRQWWPSKCTSKQSRILRITSYTRFAARYQHSIYSGFPILPTFPPSVSHRQIKSFHPSQTRIGYSKKPMTLFSAGSKRYPFPKEVIARNNTPSRAWPTPQRAPAAFNNYWRIACTSAVRLPRCRLSQIWDPSRRMRQYLPC